MNLWRVPLTIADASHRRSSIKNGGRRPPTPPPRKRGEGEVVLPLQPKLITLWPSGFGQGAIVELPVKPVGITADRFLHRDAEIGLEQRDAGRLVIGERN